MPSLPPMSERPAAALALLLLAQPAGGQEPEPVSGSLPAPTPAHRVVAGTHVSLVPPAGYGAALRFPGYLHWDGRSSIMVTELEGEKEELESVVVGLQDPMQLARGGMKLASTEARPMGPHWGHLLRIDQQLIDGPHDRWIWIFGGDTRCVMVVAACPEWASEERLEPLKEAVLSTIWEPEREVDPFADLGYVLGDTGGLRFLSRMQNQILFTPDGEPDTEREVKPMFLVGPSLGPVDTPEPLEFAVRRVRQYPFEGIELVETEEVAIAGLQGHATVAHGRDPESDVRCLLYQVVLFEQDGYYWIALGSVAAAHEERWLPVFQRVARSLRFVEREE